MNYEAHYNKLITRAQNRELPEPYETHHIIPKCMGGSNKKDNLVRLTCEEHYVAHQLLVKMHPEHKNLIFAAKMMTTNTSRTHRGNKLYGWLRRAFMNRVSELKKGKKTNFVPWNKGLKGCKIGHPKGYKITEEHRKNLSESHLGQVPWNKDSKGIMVAWNKGLKGVTPGNTHPCTDAAKELLRSANIGKTYSVETNAKKASKKCSCLICKKETTTSSLSRYHKHLD